MNEPAWLLPDVVTAIHQILLTEHGGASGTRDQTLLESALNRPQQHFFYTEKASIFDLTASYCAGLVSNHPFVDGNKRTALTVAIVFLELNGYNFTVPEPEAVIVIEQLASGQLAENTLSDWFREYSVALI